jgi:hypothetical protein
VWWLGAVSFIKLSNNHLNGFSHILFHLRYTYKHSKPAREREKFQEFFTLQILVLFCFFFSSLKKG